ncbi:MAG: hypothetical protein L7F78_09285 [Syntrophales bacterium LBB04]|nr:hypothetical protein [Syntrophales bacterium LBB04]
MIGNQAPHGGYGRSASVRGAKGRGQAGSSIADGTVRIDGNHGYNAGTAIIKENIGNLIGVARYQIARQRSKGNEISIR